MEIGEAIAHALEGRSLLFTGSGFSRGALNLRDGEFKTAFQLAEHFARIAKLPSGVALDDAAEEIVDAFGPDRLIEELEREFTTKRLLPGHSQIARIPWKRVYSTNYDNLLETAYSEVGSALNR